jgi:hypothetical protein
MDLPVVLMAAPVTPQSELLMQPVVAVVQQAPVLPALTI